MASSPTENKELVCLGPTRPRGKPCGFTEELAERICERIANGETLTAICEDEDMPSRMTVTRWLMKGLGNFPLQYARAREQQADYEAEEMRAIADNAYEDYYIDYKTGPNGEQVPIVVVNGESVRRAQLRIATRQWRAERLNRRVYGNSIRHEHELPAAAPLKPGRLPESLSFLIEGSGD